MDARKGRTKRWSVHLLLIALVFASACTKVVQQGPGAGVAAQLSVERFLQAANNRQHLRLRLQEDRFLVRRLVLCQEA